MPGRAHPQHEITAAFADLVLGAEPPGSPKRRLLEQVHASAGVRTRHLALPLTEYAGLAGFGAANDVFIEVGLALGRQVIEQALRSAGLAPADVDLLATTTVTGVAAPSLDARLVGPLGLRDDVKRVPMFGLGCVAGAAGIARLHDHLRGDPDGVAVLLSVELCSLTVQRGDASAANLVGSALFGDGAAAVVLVGDRRAAAMGVERSTPRVVATRSRLYPDSERVMGWDIGGTGFRLVLAATVADLVDKYLADDVELFLAGHGLRTGDVGTWVAHPGGPKVIEAIERALDLPPDALDVTRQSLAEVGNLSSSSVLHVLQRTLRDNPPGDRRPAVLLAMGPGFCSELVLLEW